MNTTERKRQPWGRTVVRRGVVALSVAAALAGPARAGEPFSKYLGGRGLHDVKDAVVLADGRIAAVGRVSNVERGISGFIALLAEDGTIVWQRQTIIDPGWDAHFKGVDEAQNGNLLVSGHYMAGGGAEPSDILVVEVDLTGAVVWHAVVGTPGADESKGVAGTPDGGVVVTAKNHDTLRHWVAELSGAGNLVWQGLVDDRVAVNTVDVAPDGGIYMAGRLGGPHSFVARLDPARVPEWGVAFDLGESTEFEGGAVTSDGGFVGISAFSSRNAAQIGWVAVDGTLVGSAAVTWPDHRLIGDSVSILPDGTALLVGVEQVDQATWWAGIAPDGDLLWSGQAWQDSEFRFVALHFPDGDPLLVGSSNAANASGLSSEALLMRLRPDGSPRVDCPEFGPTGLAEVTLPYTRIDVAVVLEPLVLNWERSPIGLQDATMVTSDVCCPFLDVPLEVSGPGSPEPLRFNEWRILLFQSDPTESRACWNVVHRGYVENLRTGVAPECVGVRPDGQMGDPAWRTLPGNLYWVVSGRNLLHDGPAGWSTMGEERVRSAPCP